MDRRDMDYSGILKDFNQKTMTAQFESGDETFTVKMVFEVCDLCDGKGTHVNPSIDAHGISREEFDEDPDFEEDYFSGVYDVPCNKCRGARVFAVADEDNNPKELIEKIAEHEKDLRDMYAEMAAERRNGA